MSDVPPKYLDLIVDILSYKPTCTSNYHHLCDDVKDRLTKEQYDIDPDFHDKMTEALKHGENIGLLVLNGQQVRLRFQLEADDANKDKASIYEEYETEEESESEDDTDETASQKEEEDASSWCVIDLPAHLFESSNDLKSIRDVREWHPRLTADVKFWDLAKFFMNDSTDEEAADSDDEDEEDEATQDCDDDDDDDEEKEGTELSDVEGEVEEREESDVEMGEDDDDYEESDNCSDDESDTDVSAAKRQKLEDDDD